MICELSNAAFTVTIMWSGEPKVAEGGECLKSINRSAPVLLPDFEITSELAAIDCLVAAKNLARFLINFSISLRNSGMYLRIRETVFGMLGFFCK
jgi:hypothetical protein